MKTKVTYSYWRSIKRAPKYGGEYIVVWRIQDGGYPMTTMMVYDAIEKTWTDPQNPNGGDQTDDILLWTHMPKAPRGIPKKIWQPDPKFNLPESEIPNFVSHMRGINDLLKG